MKPWFENKKDKYKYRDNPKEIFTNEKQSSIIRSLTPKDTEEIKPGVFIQETSNGYKQVHPAAWNGKINWKNFLLGANPLRNFVWFLIIIFLAWSYFYDVDAYKEFYEEVHLDPALFCSDVIIGSEINYEDTYTIQNNYEGLG